MRSVSLESLRRQLVVLEAEPLEDDEDIDPARFDWYAESCPCGLPAGECKAHQRARANQRPPIGSWGTWLTLAGRGFGKTRCAAEWARWKAESGQCRRMALVAPTAADVRDVLVEGPAGILAISPPWFMPKYEPSKRRLTWPNGAVATTFSADEPDRLRGPQHDGALADEVAAWSRPEALDMLLMGLRLGDNPQLAITTTPKPTKVIKALIADPTTVVVRGSTYENRTHLAPKFFESIIAKFEGTRLGQQELMAEILEVSDGAIYASFDATVGGKHVTDVAEYDYRFPVHLAIDCGVSKHTAAVWFQVRPVDQHRSRVTVFGDWHAEGLYSEAAAKAIKAHGQSLPSRGRLDAVRLDPASSAQTGIGPAAYGAYETVFGSRLMGRWPMHRVADGIDQVSLLIDQGLLVIHTRCTKLREALLNYAWRPGRHGEWLDVPMDPAHPHEDLADALRGGIRDRFPDGCRVEQTHFRTIKFGMSN